MSKYNTTLKLTKDQEKAADEFFNKYEDLYYDLTLLKKDKPLCIGRHQIDYINKKIIYKLFQDKPYSYQDPDITLFINHANFYDKNFVSVVGEIIGSFYIDEMIFTTHIYLCINKDYELFSYCTITDPLMVKDPYHILMNNNAFENQVFCEDNSSEIFKKENPYNGMEELNKITTKEKIIYMALYKKYPFIELLVKAGYYNIIYGWLKEISLGHKDDKFKILLKPGKDIKSVIQLPKFIYEDLKNEKDINMWHNTRLLNKKYNFTNESYLKFKDFNFGSSSLMQKILKLKFKEKYLYTLNSLMTYLSRVDMYQAIDPPEAIRILFDYLKMNIDMNVMPDTNSNSLKREHDVTVRNYNLVAKDIEESKFKSVAERLKKYEYSGKKYCIIAPKSGQDLIDEGRNNRNCVGSYIKQVISRRNMIFFMRDNKNKNKSLITIELSPDGTEIWQKFETANRTIVDADKLIFIDEWMKYIKTNIKKEA